jgi:hypothetical protein
MVSADVTHERVIAFGNWSSGSLFLGDGAVEMRFH